jgi:hypothetical protein
MNNTDKIIVQIYKTKIHGCVSIGKRNKRERGKKTIFFHSRSESADEDSSCIDLCQGLRRCSSIVCHAHCKH